MGHNIRESAGAYWFDVYPRVYSSIPFDKKIDPRDLVISEVLRKDGLVLRYPCELDFGRASYRLICSNQNYGLESLNVKARNQTRRGLENCVVRPVSFEELEKHGPKLNFETLIRQGRVIPRNFSVYWQRYYSAASSAEGAEAWGVFVAEQLAAYLISFVINDVANVLIVRSSSEFLKLYPNNALIFSYLQDALSRRQLKEVSIGFESIRADMNSLDHFKVGMGFVTAPIGQRIEMRPWLRAFTYEPMVSVVMKLARFAADAEKIDKFEGLLRWYREQRKQA